jgi:hypothetical protein
MGLAAALLAHGTATVLASVLPLRDADASELAAALDTGAAPADAQAGRLQTAGMICFGAG